MKTCPKCSTENNDDQRFCFSCGTGLQSDLEKFLEAQGISQLASVMKAHDITSMEVLKELGENDLGELGLAYGDKVRIKVAIESLKVPETDKSHAQASFNSASVPLASTVTQPLYESSRQAPYHQQPNLAEEGKKLLRQAAVQGMSKASEIMAKTERALNPEAEQLPASVEIEAEDAALFADIHKTYTFLIWGWLTYGILYLVAWSKIHKNRSKVQSELLKSHRAYQSKISWIYFGVVFCLTILAAMIGSEGFSGFVSLVNLGTLVWYVRAAWKGRKALKFGLSPGR
jgi:hypothetical protein